jgi:hypothetical protein
MYNLRVVRNVTTDLELGRILRDDKQQKMDVRFRLGGKYTDQLRFRCLLGILARNIARHLPAQGNAEQREMGERYDDMKEIVPR